MKAPRNTGRRSHDHEEKRPKRDPQRRSERLAQEAAAGSDAPLPSPGGAAHPTVPSTPGELVAMQRLLSDPLISDPPLPEQLGTQARVAQALTLLRSHALNAWESQQIALALLQQLDGYHQGVVAELHDSPESTPAQMACWAIDGDRLMHCRRLLESITLI